MGGKASGIRENFALSRISFRYFRHLGSKHNLAICGEIPNHAEPNRNYAGNKDPLRRRKSKLWFYVCRYCINYRTGDTPADGGEGVKKGITHIIGPMTSECPKAIAKIAVSRCGRK